MFTWEAQARLWLPPVAESPTSASCKARANSRSQYAQCSRLKGGCLLHSGAVSVFQCECRLVRYRVVLWRRHGRYSGQLLRGSRQAFQRFETAALPTLVQCTKDTLGKGRHNKYIKLSKCDSSPRLEAVSISALVSNRSCPPAQPSGTPAPCPHQEASATCRGQLEAEQQRHTRNIMQLAHNAADIHTHRCAALARTAGCRTAQTHCGASAGSTQTSPCRRISRHQRTQST